MSASKTIHLSPSPLSPVPQIGKGGRGGRGGEKREGKKTKLRHKATLKDQVISGFIGRQTARLRSDPMPAFLSCGVWKWRSFRSKGGQSGLQTGGWPPLPAAGRAKRRGVSTAAASLQSGAITPSLLPLSAADQSGPCCQPPSPDVAVLS